MAYWVLMDGAFMSLNGWGMSRNGQGIRHLMGGSLWFNGWNTYGLNGWGSYEKISCSLEHVGAII